MCVGGGGGSPSLYKYVLLFACLAIFARFRVTSCYTFNKSSNKKGRVPFLCERFLIACIIMVVCLLLELSFWILFDFFILHLCSFLLFLLLLLLIIILAVWRGGGGGGAGGGGLFCLAIYSKCLHKLDYITKYEQCVSRACLTWCRK